jgi:hypothetical protein
MCPRLSSNSPSFCLSIPGAMIIGISHCAQLNLHLLFGVYYLAPRCFRDYIHNFVKGTTEWLDHKLLNFFLLNSGLHTLPLESCSQSFCIFVFNFCLFVFQIRSQDNFARPGLKLLSSCFSCLSKLVLHPRVLLNSFDGKNIPYQIMKNQRNLMTESEILRQELHFSVMVQNSTYPD